MTSSDQNCWGPQVDDATTPGADTTDDDCFFGGANETRSRAMLVFSEALGREVGRFKFPENPPERVRWVSTDRDAGVRRSAGGADARPHHAAAHAPGERQGLLQMSSTRYEA